MKQRYDNFQGRDLTSVGSFFMSNNIYTMKYFKITAVEAEVIVVSKDSEEAAWQALQICNSQGYTLIDINEIEIDPRKDYYPNRADSLIKTDADMFEPLEFDEFMEWRGNAWELSDGYHSIIRVHNKKTGKVRERVYKKQAAAVAYVKKLMKDKDVYFDIATENGVIGYP